MGSSRMSARALDATWHWQVRSRGHCQAGVIPPTNIARPRSGQIYCASSEGWRVQRETDPPGQESEPRSLDGSGVGKPTTLKPIDNTVRGAVASHQAVTQVNGRCGLEMSGPGGRTPNKWVKAAGSTEVLTEAVVPSGGVKPTAW